MTSLHKRAFDEMRRWRTTLTRKARAKLYGSPLSAWAWKGGNIILAKAPPRRQAKQRTEREQLKLNREARHRAERAAYEDARP